MGRLSACNSAADRRLCFSSVSPGTPTNSSTLQLRDEEPEIDIEEDSGSGGGGLGGLLGGLFKRK